MKSFGQTYLMHDAGYLRAGCSAQQMTTPFGIIDLLDSSARVAGIFAVRTQGVCRVLGGVVWSTGKPVDEPCGKPVDEPCGAHVKRGFVFISGRR
jgi:hypothetical protein